MPVHRPGKGFLDPSLLAADVVERGDRLADAAKAARWDEVLEVLGELEMWP